MQTTGACPHCFGDLSLVSHSSSARYRCADCRREPRLPVLRVPYRLGRTPRRRLIRRIRPRGSSGQLV